MTKKTPQQIVVLIEAFVALCLGSSDRIAWFHQAEAAAYTDGEKIFLPTPSGVDGELELLLSIAMREVAKITHTSAASFATADKPSRGYAASIEDARIKQAVSAEYKGAFGIFDAATTVAHAIALRECQKPGANPDLLKQLAVWFAANDALLGSEASAAAAEHIGALAKDHVDANALQRVIGLTQASPHLGSTQASIACATKIHTLFHPQPEGDPPSQPQSGDPDPSQDDSEDEAETPANGESAHSEDSDPNSDDESDLETASETDAGEPQQPSGSDDSHDSEDKSDTQESSDSDSGESSEQEDSTVTQGGAPGDDQQQQDDATSPSNEADSGKSEQQSNDAGETTPQQGNENATPTSELDDAPANGVPQGSPAGNALPGEGSPSADSGSNTQFDQSTDSLSNLLAMLKGFSCARDIPASEVTKAKGNEPNAHLLQELEEALRQDDAMQMIAELDCAIGDPTGSADESPADEAEPEVDLMLALGASGGIAPLTFNAVNELDAVAGRLVNVLLRELHDKRPTKILLRSSGCDVDVQRLWRLKRLGDTRVFRKKTPSSGIDAAVWMLLDRSGSMFDKIETAANATSAFVLALQRISGVQTAIDVFPTERAGGSENLLKFRQNTTQARDKLKWIGADGGTPTDEAIRNIVPQLLATSVEKRVIVLITDGEPDDLQQTRMQIANAKAQGIDVIGIGIGAEASIEDILPERSVSIEEVGDLAKALETLFRTKLSTALMAA